MTENEPRSVTGAPIRVLRELEKYRAGLERAIAAVDEIMRLVQSLPPRWEGITVEFHAPGGPPELEPTRAPQLRRGRSVVKPAVIDILKTHAPRAIHADQVVAELRQRGISLSAKDPKATAVTAMIRLDRQRRERGDPQGVEKLPNNLFRWVDSLRESESDHASLRAATDA